MKVTIIGNGILALMSALRLLERDNTVKITIIGPNDREGCATLAAPAMLNSYAELVEGSLNTKIDQDKFKISQLARQKWSNLFDSLSSSTSLKKPTIGMGTYVVNNATSNELEDKNFLAIIDYLKEYNEVYELVNNSDIPNYNPSAHSRALQAIYIPNEGFVNSEEVLMYLQSYLQEKGILFIDAKVKKLLHKDNQITHAYLENGDTYTADTFILAPGANFSIIINNSNLPIKMQTILYGSGVALELNPNKNNLSNCIRTPNRGLACGVYSAPRTANSLFIGASNLVGTNKLSHGRVTSIYALLKSAMQEIDSDFYRAELLDVKVGWRPTSVDTYPLIGQTSINNLIVATGTKRDGFHMSPIISEYITALCLSENYEHQELFSAFIPERELIRNISREDAISQIIEHQISALFQHDFEPAKSDMLNDYRDKLRTEINAVHDKIGAITWGIPPELYNVYKNGYLD